MKNILIASFDMEVGGVERSLVSMLNNFDYKNYKVDLMLYSHTGDFMELLPAGPTLLPENNIYKTFRMPVSAVLKKGNWAIGVTRMLARYKANLQKNAETGYKQMQYMWKYALPFLPKMEKEYDIAISYLWPHFFVAEKVKAKTKIAWIHTDYSTVEIDVKLDLELWSEFDYIVAVSEECKRAFLLTHPSLHKKVLVIENITSPEFVRDLSNELVEDFITQDRRFKLLSVGRLSYAKGIDIAVKALEILKNKGYNNISWYVVGYGGEENNIRELIRENKLEDSFILLGKKINPYPYMKIADIYVQPSRYEGKAVTVSEAQIIGKPVLITNYMTANSQVHNGVDGSICDLTPEGLADGIEKLYKNKEERSKLERNCSNTIFDNRLELEKLYKII
ncbi:glycosyltransferase [Rossellomorea aquimaris]|uniref:Glycosyltransferase involved in cell wall biosynthesis n=1 Tax=Rossellomorea aquimaris TaxID=189382 RepID=A0A366EL44_9BACI|nr:glycosyltransferase [Rossellomorea aquimaris]RBP03152.1 glycosyltransferase involved in cell wall biosynthesis [Rossellomorea aquimaris]